MARIISVHEALFIGYPETGLDDHNPIKSWYSELTAKPGERQAGLCRMSLK